MRRLLGVLTGVLWAASGLAADRMAPTLIPQPVKMVHQPGVFRLESETRIRTDVASQGTGIQLAERLRTATGYPFAVGPLSEGKPVKGVIVLTTRDVPAGLGSEGYELVVNPDSVVLRAAEPAGLFYGVQSLLQLLPPQVFATKPVQEVAWEIPALQIQDQPLFPWRGMMLDTGRHYFPVADIKQMLDVMALHKLNTFHWHLTEDQGWRIEIKKYPRLTELGAWRASTPPYGQRNSDDGQRYGGFYTQADIREIVAYAAARHITVVPEIEMPGHASAAIAAYPELGNSDIPGYAPRVMTRWGVHPYIFAPREETFQFLEDVLTEVCELFPSEYVHIGGDEAPKGQWEQSPFAQEVMRREGLQDEHELQSWFIRRIETILAAKGRRLIGWDEIQEGGLPKTATLMVWRDSKWANHALGLGNNVVMATTSHTYLDYYQAPAASELAKGVEYESIGGYLPLEKVYSYNPAFVAENPAQERRILGAQAQLWTEYIKDIGKLQYLALPRLSALAEVAWSPWAAHDYDDFLRRLEDQYERFEQLGLRYYREPSKQADE